MIQLKWKSYDPRVIRKSTDCKSRFYIVIWLTNIQKYLVTVLFDIHFGWFWVFFTVVKLVFWYFVPIKFVLLFARFERPGQWFLTSNIPRLVVRRLKFDALLQIVQNVFKILLPIFMFILISKHQIAFCFTFHIIINLLVCLMRLLMFSRYAQTLHWRNSFRRKSIIHNAKVSCPDSFQRTSKNPVHVW